MIHSNCNVQYTCTCTNLDDNIAGVVLCYATADYSRACTSSTLAIICQVTLATLYIVMYNEANHHTSVVVPCFYMTVHVYDLAIVHVYLFSHHQHSAMHTQLAN